MGTADNKGYGTYQPNDRVPKEFLALSGELASREKITERQFIDLCKLLVRLVDSGRVDHIGASHMAYHIAGIWLSHATIDSVDSLGEIGGQFSDLEIEGAFRLDSDFEIQEWNRLKSWIDEADRHFPPIEAIGTTEPSKL